MNQNRYLWQNCYEQGETGYCPRERPYRPFSNGSLRFENSHSSFLYYSTRFEKCGYLPGWASVNTAFYSCYAGPGPERATPRQNGPVRSEGQLDPGGESKPKNSPEQKEETTYPAPACRARDTHRFGSGR